MRRYESNPLTNIKYDSKTMRRFFPATRLMSASQYTPFAPDKAFRFGGDRANWEKTALERP